MLNSVAVTVTIVVHALTCLSTLALLFVRHFRPLKKKDAVLDNALKVLVGGVLVETAAAAITFIAKAPAPPPIQTMTVRVAASADIQECFSEPLEPASNAFVQIPSKHQAAFVLASADRWTNDPLDAIETLIRNVTFRWNMSRWVQEYRECGADPEVFLNQYVRRVFDSLVARGLASTRPAKQGAEVRDRAMSFLRFELIPRIQAACDDPTQMLADIDCTPQGSFFEPVARARVEAWKRILGLELADQPNAFGPYFGTDARFCAPPKEGKWSEFPLVTANSGALIAVEYRLGADGRWCATDNRIAFSSTGNVIDNSSGQEKWFRLLMNDNVPDDNGSGFADVRIELQSIR